MKKVTYLAIILTAVIMTAAPQQSTAVQLLSPFGGKVEEYDPMPTGCITKITLPLLETSYLVTVEKIKVGPPKSATLGILRIDFVPVMPFLTHIYRYYAYFVPGTWVVGNSINLCSVCQKVEEAGEKVGAGFAKDICESIPGIGDVLSTICGVAASGCPIDNLVYQIGTGSPIAGTVEDIVSTIKKGVCKKITGSIPLIGDFLSGLCD